MNEKNLKVLEQYELEVNSVRRGRDCYLADTDQGLVLLKEYNGSNKRCEWMEQVCRCLETEGMPVEMPLRNREGSFISTDREERRFLVKQWVNGREIDVKNSGELLQATAHLALLHSMLKGFSVSEAVCRVSLPDVYEKRMKELRKIYRYIRGKKRKNAFELEFLGQYGHFMDLCVQAGAHAKEEAAQEVQERAWNEGYVCHGDYNQHNILKYDGQLVAVNFENCGIGSPTLDLYSFMRKMLEKHNWSMELGDAMLQAYLKRHPLSDGELFELYIQFEFSEKFWKIANRYYNSKKTWIPDRSLQKLEKLVSQSKQQEAFLQHYKQVYLA